MPRRKIAARSLRAPACPRPSVLGGALALFVLAAIAVIGLDGLGNAAAAAKRLADLRVTAAKAAAGDGRVTVTATVRNAGRAASRATDIAIVLSRDAVRGPDDVSLVKTKLKALKPRKSATVRLAVQPPAAASLDAGTWLLLACADDRRAVKEGKEADNCRRASSLQGTKAAPSGPAAPASPAAAAAPASPAAPAPSAPTTPTTPSPPSTPPADTTAPETLITDGPTGTVTADSVTFTFTSSESGGRFECQVDLNGWTPCASPHVLSDLPGGDRRFDVRAVDAAGNTDSSAASRTWTLVRPAPAPGPTDAPAADPEIVAPAVDQAAPESVFEATSFLFEGANPIQVGVEQGAIAEQRVAVLRGCVRSRLDSPLEGVRVTVVDHPELGRTSTRVDGCFDLAVNGGGAVTLEFEREGYVPLQRTVEPGWEDYDRVEQVVLVPYDVQATEVDLADPTATVQVVRGSEVSDPDGDRQATLMFDAGTDAVMELPDGSTRPLDQMRVRATEFTIDPAGGPDEGTAAMPGDLPPTSAFTYAAEFSVDQAVRAGATEVRFDKPVATYLENFLDIDVGEAVPAGWYDREEGVWKAGRDGRVIKVLAEQDGVAQIDVTGDGQADSGAALDALGIDAAELRRVAQLYAPGDELWRMSIDHFTPWDFNFPYGPPDDARPPQLPKSAGGGGGGGGGPKGGPKDPDCNKTNSIISCQRQSVAEEVPVAGAPFALRYDSDRVPGRADAFNLVVPVGPAPASAKEIRVTVDVAGRRLAATLPRTSTRWLATWDGKDGFGRSVLGEQEAHIEVSYVYAAQYRASASAFAASFGAFSGSRVIGDKARREITASQSWTTTMGGWSPRAVGLGGWTATIHHAYDPIGKRLLLGDGREVSVADDVRLQLLEHFAGRDWSSNAEPTLARQTTLSGPAGLAIAPDGAVILAERDGQDVRRLASDGSKVDNVIGTGTAGASGDNGPAAEAQVASPQAVAVAPDGAVLVADTMNNRVRRIEPDGSKVTTIAGGGSPADGLGDGGPATAARLRRPAGIVAAADGAVYVSESAGHRIRRIGPDGVITTAAGTGVAGLGGDGGPGLEAELNGPEGMAIDENGVLYVADTRNDRIRRLRPDGILETVAGGGAAGSGARDGVQATSAVLDRPQSVAVTLGGELLIADTGHARVRRVNTDGTITTFAGGGTGSTAGAAGTSPAAVRLGTPVAVAVAPDGTVYIVDADTARVHRVAAPMQGFADGDILLPSSDGSQIFQFDASTGRHERTLDAFTRVPVWRFGYDGDGHLASITDRGGKVTRIERNADGIPTAIVGPRGHRTTLELDADGWLHKVTDEAGRESSATYHPGGLIASFTDVAGESSSYTYDDDGRVVSSRNVAGGESTYTRSEIDNGVRIVARDAGGRETTYETTHQIIPRDPADPAAGGVEASVFEITLPTGAKRRQETLADGTVRTTTEDGTSTVDHTAPDPRWGVLVASLERSESRTPGGRTSVMTTTRTVELADAANPLSLTRQVDARTVNGQTSTSTFDFASLQLTEQSPTGRRRVITYGAPEEGAAAGRPASDRSDDLPATTMTYDQWGRVTRVAQGERDTVYTYDARGRVIQTTDATGRTHHYGYDDADRVVDSRAGAGGPTVYGYDPRGMLDAVTTPDGVTTSLTYDVFGRFASWQSPAAASGGALPAARTWDYRTDGSLRRKTTEDGRVIDYALDAGGRPASVTTPEATVERGYAGDTTRTAALARVPGSGTEERTTYSYDGALSTGETATGSAPFSVAYAYNGWDKGIETATLTSGADTVTTAYARNADGNGTQLGPYAITRGGPLGAPVSYTAGTDVLAFGYDELGRPHQRTRTVDSRPVHQLTVEHDAGDRITSVTQRVGTGADETRTYDYDEDGRLTAVRDGGGEVEAYGYDARGNRTSARRGADPARTATYDRRDRVTAVDLTPYGYDEAGRLTSRGADTFAYDAEGRLLRATVGGDAWSFAYDAIGRRVAKTGPAGTWAYLYGDPADIDRVTAVREPGGTLTTLRYDELGKPLAIERGGTRYAVAVDQVGTPVAVADPSGAIVKRVQRDAYGELVDDSDPSFLLPVGFAGGLDDRELGLVHLGARDYEPATGRFTTPDPAGFSGGQTNLYAYTGGDPVDRRDPHGLMAQHELGPADGGWGGPTYVPPRAPDPVIGCAGGAVYGIIGGGVKKCWDSDGKSVTCAEFGMGIGVEGTMELPSQLPSLGTSVGFKGGLEVGVGGIGGQATMASNLDKCGRPKSPAFNWAAGAGVGVIGGEIGSDGPKVGVLKGHGAGKLGASGRGMVEKCWES